MNSSSA